MSRSTETSEGSMPHGVDLRAVIDAAADGIALVVAGRVQLANRALRKLLGLEPAMPPSSGAADCELDNCELARRMQPLVERAALPAPGSTLQSRLLLASLPAPVRVDVLIVSLAAPSSAAVFVRPADADDHVAARPRDRDRDRAMDRLVTLGQLAAGVAHDINNPLAYVLGSIEFAEAALKGSVDGASKEERDSAILAAIVNAREGAERVRTVVRDVMAFSRPIVEARSLVNVEAVLDASVRLAWNEIRHRARLVKRYSRVPRVLAHESRLSQVFLNLIVNAAQAIDAKAKRDAEIALSTSVEADRVVIEVSDTGPGIAEADLPYVFERFHTTKPASVGTGLGLAICQDIVSSYGGDIVVGSRRGEGATFRVLLPVALGTPELTAPAPELSAPEAVSRARILIIDDEPLLGQTLGFAFSGRHDVVVTASGREALSRLAQDSRFDLVLCDLMMPDVPGQKVFEMIERDHPHLVACFVFMTGGAFTDTAQEFLERYPGRRVDKPFTLAQIEQLLATKR